MIKEREFDLSYWLNNTDVTLKTRCGYPVKILTHERKAKQEGPIVALVEKEKNNQIITTYYPNGKTSLDKGTNNLDILMEVYNTEPKQTNNDWFG